MEKKLYVVVEQTTGYEYDENCLEQEWWSSDIVAATYDEDSAKKLVERLRSTIDVDECDRLGIRKRYYYTTIKLVTDIDAFVKEYGEE